MQQTGAILPAPGTNRIAEIYTREQERFLRFIRRNTYGDESLDAEEVLSDVITHLLERSGLVAGIENLTAYIYRSLSNRILDRRRSRKPQISLDASDENDAPLFTPADTRPLPDEEFENNELAATLYQAIDELAPAERAIFIATEMDGRTFAELAEEWDEPIGTLLSRKSRAAAKLRKQLSHIHNTPKESL